MFGFRVVISTVIALLFCLSGYVQSQTVEDVKQAIRLADKLWKVVEITKQDKPQPGAQVVLEAPKGEREKVTLYGEEAAKLVVGDVIKFGHTPTSVMVNPGSQPSSAHDLEFDRPSWGKTRWKAESVK